MGVGPRTAVFKHGTTDLQTWSHCDRAMSRMVDGLPCIGCTRVHVVLCCPIPEMVAGERLGANPRRDANSVIIMQNHFCCLKSLQWRRQLRSQQVTGLLQ
ncbi:unnamed protein product [Arctogadus glacialis]